MWRFKNYPWFAWVQWSKMKYFSNSFDHQVFKDKGRGNATTFIFSESLI